MKSLEATAGAVEDNCQEAPFKALLSRSVPPNRISRRNTTAAQILALGLGLVALGGCNSDNNAATPSDATSSAAVQTSDGDSVNASVSEKDDSLPILDDNAVNDDGLIVLESEIGATVESTDVPLTAQPSGSELTAPSLPPLQPNPQPAAEDLDGLTLEAPITEADTGTTDSTTPPSISDAGSAAAEQSNSNVNAQPVAGDITKSSLPAEANVATDAERNQEIAPDWPQPQTVLFLSGQQHGYIEPCGCTGLENQKGGLIRRDTLLTSLRDRGWNIVPMDVGNQVRRTGRQPTLKFQSTVDAFKMMGYRAATLGIDDLQLAADELIQIAGSDGANEMPFVSANVVIYGEPAFFPSYRIVESGGRKIGITGVLGGEYKRRIQSSEVECFDPVERLKPVVSSLKEAGCDFLVLLAHASTEESASIAQSVPGFDLVVTAGGFGEPTLIPEKIEGSDAVMLQVGTKGMWGGIVGLFDDADAPIRYQKIAISSQFKDSPRMLAAFAEYQEQLKLLGLSRLGASPLSHPTGHKFVGSEVCGDCHTTAYDIWKNSPHVHATDSIVAADNDRGGIPRHHDPECISCHATGWNPQGFYPYTDGFKSPEETPKMVGSGCENCHGPGSEHVAAEMGDIDVSQDRILELQQQMVLKLDRARETCLKCHDLDNSPDFHVDGAFDEYWEQVKHYGKD